jgi:hypothetical protein
MRRLCSSVLGMEAVLLLLMIVPAKVLEHVSGGTAAAVGGGLALVAIAGSLLQIAIIASGVLMPAMYVLGVIFAALWVTGIWLARKWESADSPRVTTR